MSLHFYLYYSEGGGFIFIKYSITLYKFKQTVIETIITFLLKLKIVSFMNREVM